MSEPIRRIDPDDEASLAAYVRIRNTVAPESTDSLEQIRWERATYPGQGARLLALDGDGAAVGTASVGRIWMYGPEFERYWLGIWVLPDARGHGLGSALYAAASDVAREAGKTGFQTEVSEVHVDGLRFLANRGFVETDRSKMVRLDLAGLPPPDPAPPAGIRLVSLAERPDVLPGVHATALEAFPDIPGDEDLHVGTLDEFVARDVDRAGIPRDAFFVAIDDASGEVVGYASLLYDAASTSRRVPRHDGRPARLPRPRHRRRAQAGDDRVGDRARPRGAGHRQRRGQRADARRQPRPGLPAGPGLDRAAGTARPGRLSPAAVYRASRPEGITTGNS